MKKLFIFDTSSYFKFSLKFSIVSSSLILVLSILLTLIIGYDKEDTTLFILMGLTPLPIIYSFYYYRYKSNVELVWKGYIILGLWINLFTIIGYIIVGIVNTIIFKSHLEFEDLYLWIFFGFFNNLIIGMLSSIISGIFFERSPVKKKLKRLLSILLFVWALYKIVKSFIGEDEESEGFGIDTDGDGINDSFDTDGDGKIDQVFLDTDGDGISDTVAMDTDGDGLIDTVASDTDSDGKIDTIISDTDGDGEIDTILK
jgi:hypothetical protein